MIELHHGDCLDVLRGLADSSVDAVVTDPPYFRVKSDEWDRQWSSAAGYLAWMSGVLAEFQRVLAPNGSLYLFASPQMAAAVQMETAKYFRVLNEIVWVKRDAAFRRACADRLRSYHPQTERIIFAEHYAQSAANRLANDARQEDVFVPLREWLKAEFTRAGWTGADLNRICGTRSRAGRHYTARSQWALPTEAHYTALQTAAPPGVLRRDYECLRRQFEALRRPFLLTNAIGMTDFWEFDTVPHRKGRHPCEKPLPLMQHILQTSVRPGGVVLDPFLGSGTTGVAARQGGFGFIGIEQSGVVSENGKNRTLSSSAL